MLLLRRGQVVDPQRILELVWGHEAVSLTPAVVHTVVSRLRRSLGTTAVETTPTGYRLGPGSLDSDEFVQAVEPPGRESPQETVDRLRAALSIWRGPTAYADVDATLLSAEGTRLEELRALARHHLVDALLDQRTTEATTEALGLAQARVAEDPLDERAHEQVMLAAYRAGRPADAVAAYGRLASTLRDELGLDPGQPARDLHARILARDPDLLAADRGSPRPPRTGPAAPLGPLVGREAELEQLSAELGRHRLVTVTGPGGVGKTRLITETWFRLVPGVAVGHHDFAGGEEGDIGEDDLAEGLGRSLGLTLPPDHPLDGLVRALGERRITIFLDEAERVAPELAAVVETVTARCPEVRFVVASRRPLGLAGEWEMPLAPLAYPAPQAPVAEVRRAPAVRLLGQLLAERGSGTALDHPETVARLAQMARRVDGLPLALVLVAGQADGRSLEELQTLLERPLDLTSTRRVASERHHSLRETILWSAERLPPEHRAVLRRLGVFAGPFSTAAAQAVATSAGAEDVAAVCRLLARDALVQVQRGPDGSLSWRLLTAVRDLAREGLVADGSLDRARLDHRRWHAERWRNAPRSDLLLTDVAAHYDDYLDAARSALEARDAESLGDLVLALGRLWLFTDAQGAGRRWFDRALDSGLLSGSARSRVLVQRASLVMHRDPEAARGEIAAAIPGLQDGDPDWLVGAHVIAAVAAFESGHQAEARDQARLAVTAGRRSTTERLADALAVLAFVTSVDPDDTARAEASDAIREAWALVRSARSAAATASVTNNLCHALIALGRADEASSWLSTALADLGDLPAPLFLRHTAAWVALGTGHARESLAQFAAVLADSSDHPVDARSVETFLGSGAAARRLGDRTTGDELVAGAHLLASRMGFRLSPWMEGLAPHDTDAAGTAALASWATDALGRHLARLVNEADQRAT